jgi:phosphatidylserine/phosphatidylglycerophosphate/cardiolipin synthase-like enzyme
MKYIFILLLLHCYSRSSPSSDFIRLIYENSVYKTYFSYPDRKVSLEKRKEVQNKIIELMDSSQKEIRIFAYGFVGEELQEALARAKNRGLKILFWGDPGTDYTEVIQKGIPVIVWKNVAIQHSKVMVFDQKKVFLGTGNFTHYGLIHDWNYYLDFNLEPSQVNGFLEYLEGSDFNPTRKIGNDTFYSSPKYGKFIQDRMISLIDLAQYKIDYLIFDHFDPMITLAIQLASERGVVIRGIYNSPIDVEGKKLSKILMDPRSSIWEEKNEDYYQDAKGRKGGLLHHKTMSIDDKILLVGSYNYSVSARDKNREVVLESKDQSLIHEFQKEWQRVQSQSEQMERGEREFKFTYEQKIQVEWGKESFRLIGEVPYVSFVIRLRSNQGSHYGWIQNPRKSGDYSYSLFNKYSSGIFSREGSGLLYRLNFDKAELIFPSLQRIHPIESTPKIEKLSSSKSYLDEIKLESNGIWIRYSKPLKPNGMIFASNQGWMSYIYNRTNGEWKFLEWESPYSIKETNDFILVNDDKTIIHSPKKESREEWMEAFLTMEL